MKKTIFIAGTDTDVGKTVASKAILHGLNKKGLKTIGFKPIAAGCEETPQGLRNSDALHLQEAASVESKYDAVNPYALRLPASPHIAANIESVKIEEAVLNDHLGLHQQNSEFLLVEGAGGWRVPMTESKCLSEWVQQHNLPVVLVVGIKLGCLSHAMLTAETIERDGLNIVGWVANRINPGQEHYREIIDMLEDKINAPKLGEIPYLPGIKKRDLSSYLDVEPLLV
jgi:dethiobiotin synthetase